MRETEGREQDTVPILSFFPEKKRRESVNSSVFLSCRYPFTLFSFIFLPFDSFTPHPSLTEPSSFSIPPVIIQLIHHHINPWFIQRFNPAYSFPMIRSFSFLLIFPFYSFFLSTHFSFLFLFLHFHPITPEEGKGNQVVIQLLLSGYYWTSSPSLSWK